MKNFKASDWEKRIPIPVYEEFPEYFDFYKKAFELAHAHIKEIDGMPQSPYMDEALCDTQVWIWDSCFMSLFCKYGGDVFPGVETLNNFYEALYGEKGLPYIIPTAKEPKWTGAVAGEPFKIEVHIADNPPLFAWAEYENALFHGDKEYVKKLISRGVLQKHYEWLESLSDKTAIEGVHCRTHWTNEDIGYRWEGGRSGMDNTPRGRIGNSCEKERPQNRDALWVDAICQQALSARMIAKLCNIAGDGKAAAEWNEKFLEKKDIINKYYWDIKDGIYYDIDVSTKEFYKVITPAAYWAMTAEIASDEQANKMLKYLLDENALGGKVPIVSLARNDADFSEDGKYWRGGLWLPTAYSTLKGLANYGYFKEAAYLARRIFDHMLATYTQYEPHTIWECYSPTKPEPATSVDGVKRSRPDFCGWSALGPISIYIEYILGFHTVNAFERVVEWELDKELTGRAGIENLRFGDIVTDIIAENGVCTVVSNAPYTLKICDVPYSVGEGKTVIKI